MKKMLAKSLLVIIEAGIEVLTARIKKRGLRNGNRRGLDNIRGGDGAYDLRYQSAARPFPLHVRWAVKRNRRHRRSISEDR